ncbi:nuclear transport factor 2 family protein [Aequorivita sp. KMM 9714]|uniref:nuclear transport factor 2 family protein n=1 Tax=Aequorivita sp. KMM 9714 TaxID=2707173 RepID=UPI0013EA46AC|nr:nuclear transport factor 2 family protein [Aequorivita sp. KMM 9714]NGX83567.1 nuclear transport factor 2 family protein [Aequorivita sp. KMM 9714]
MKRILFLALSMVFLFTACQKQDMRYTQQSPEIDTYKKIINAYEKQDWEALASHYADTAKIMNNVIEKEGKTIAEEIAMGKEDAALFSSWDYVDGESDYEMVVTDKGKTYVNFWGTWKGTLAANNKTYTIPAHITAQFVDGKVVKEFGYWDISKIMLDIQSLQQAEIAVMKDSTRL